jgi:hypothetical protein
MEISTGNYVWLKTYQGSNFKSPMISAITLKNDETRLILAGTCIVASKTFYYIVDPNTGLSLYDPMILTHDRDFHFLSA